MKRIKVEAGTMRRAIRLVRDNLGEDAVVLHTKESASGVRLIVGYGFDDSTLEATEHELEALRDPSAENMDASASSESSEAEAKAREAESGFAKVLNTLRRKNASGAVDAPESTRERKTGTHIEAPSTPKKVAVDQGSHAPPRRLKNDSGHRSATMPGNRRIHVTEDSIAEEIDERHLLAERAPLPAQEEPTTQAQRKQANVETQSQPKNQALGGDNTHTAPATEAPAAEKPSASATSTVSDGAVDALREEVSGLRELFETQLAMMGWDQQNTRSPQRAALLRNLSRLGIESDVAERFANEVKPGTDGKVAMKQAMQRMTHQLKASDDPLLDSGGVAVMVGPTGVGKTTTCAKIASHYAQRHGRDSVAMITTDNYRIGGQNQLRHYASIIGVPVYSIGDDGELESIISSLSNKSLVIIDTAGMGRNDSMLTNQLTLIRKHRRHMRPYLVLPGNAQTNNLEETVRQYLAVKPVGAVVTKTDEATSMGPVVTTLLRHDLPVAYECFGQRVPEDFCKAQTQRIMRNALALAQRFSRKPSEDRLAMDFGHRKATA